MAAEHDTSAEGARERADRHLADALERTGLPDPRERYRAWLRELRSRDERAFRLALEYYEEQLVPAVGDARVDPIEAWTEYGLRLAQRLRPGSPVAIDPTGFSRPCDATAGLDQLVLQLPTSARETALPVRLPAQLTPAQAATHTLLVEQDVD